MPEDDLSSIFESSVPEPDKQARREQDYLLKKMKWNNDWQYVVHCSKIAIFLVCVLLLLTFIVIRSLALVAPPLVPWMTEEKVRSFDEFFIHGTIGAIVAGVLRKSFKYEMAE